MSRLDREAAAVDRLDEARDRYFFAEEAVETAESVEGKDDACTVCFFAEEELRNAEEEYRSAKEE